MRVNFPAAAREAFSNAVAQVKLYPRVDMSKAFQEYLVLKGRLHCFDDKNELLEVPLSGL